MSYAESFRDPRWQKKRLKIMERDNFTCRHCRNKEKTLNVHHLRYSGGKKPWEYDDQFLVTLCEGCHEKIEEERALFALALVDRQVFCLYSAIRKFSNRHGLEFVSTAISLIESVGHAYDRSDSKQVMDITCVCHGIGPSPQYTPEQRLAYDLEWEKECRFGSGGL